MTPQKEDDAMSDDKCSKCGADIDPFKWEKEHIAADNIAYGLFNGDDQIDIKNSKSEIMQVAIDHNLVKSSFNSIHDFEQRVHLKEGVTLKMRSRSTVWQIAGFDAEVRTYSHD